MNVVMVCEQIVAWRLVAWQLCVWPNSAGTDSRRFSEVHFGVYVIFCRSGTLYGNH